MSFYSLTWQHKVTNHDPLNQKRAAILTFPDYFKRNYAERACVKAQVHTSQFAWGPLGP